MPETGNIFEGMLLIVEDHDDSGESLRRFLSKHGYKCVLVKTGEAALRAVREQRVDAMVLDYGLPDIDGIDVLREVKSDPDHAKIPVVFFSASFSNDVAREAIRMGAHDWLVKGVHAPSQLVNAVKKIYPPSKPV